MSKYNQNSLCKRSGQITIQFFVNASCSNRCQMCWAGNLVKSKLKYFGFEQVNYVKIEVVLAGKPFNLWSKGFKFVLHDLLQYKWWIVKKDLSQDLQPDATFPKNEETLVCICLATKGLSLLFIFEEWKYSFQNQLSFALSCKYFFMDIFVTLILVNIIIDLEEVPLKANPTWSWTKDLHERAPWGPVGDFAAPRFITFSLAPWSQVGVQNFNEKTKQRYSHYVCL